MYTDITFILLDAVLNYHRFKACQDESFKALEDLASLKAQKNIFLTQYQAVKSSRDQHQHWQAQLTNRIESIHEEIAKLQTELRILEPELATVNAHIKAEDT